MKNKHHHIYGLYFNLADNDIVFYVGHTNNLERRTEEHLTNAFNPEHAEYNTEKYQWCRSLREQGIEYNLKPLKLWATTEDDSEYEWILRVARDNEDAGIRFYDGGLLCNMKAGDFIHEMMADRTINTAKDIADFRRNREKLKTERRSYLRDFSGSQETTPGAQKIIDWLQADSAIRRQEAEEALKRQQIKEGKYNAMLADPARALRIKQETERMQNGNKEKN